MASNCLSITEVLALKQNYNIYNKKLLAIVASLQI